MKKSIMEEFGEIAQQAADLQKQIDEYEGVQHVDVVCECGQVYDENGELDRTAADYADAPVGDNE